MKKYTAIHDITDLHAWIEEARHLKKDPFAFEHLGKRKTLCMLFFNPSLRTRISTEKAARNLGMEVIILNVGSDSWVLEFEDGTVMNAGSSEHIREAAGVLSQYADVLAVRAFPELKSRTADEDERILTSFIQHASIPVVNMESATAHPLQALSDAITISEQQKTSRPKVVLSWAPHPKALPHAVANSFVQIMKRMPVDLTITHPEGYDLNPEVTGAIPINYNQEEALQEADFVYVKNWSSYLDYGKVLEDPQGVHAKWIMTKEKLGKAQFMHCLPVRRNVVVEDAVLDSTQSLVLEQANNRTYAAQLALKKILADEI
ncbi:N-acetylornithine carbamoyltransferase [Croceiramulus getboli]|nr:N-acetylornithine carbamoyltransferase [Flavobacteriaceae bacterium YJPT1-3]